jgi:hypothetical protein
LALVLVGKRIRTAEFESFTTDEIANHIKRAARDRTGDVVRRCRTVWADVVGATDAECHRFRGNQA